MENIMKRIFKRKSEKFGNGFEADSEDSEEKIMIGKSEIK